MRNRDARLARAARGSFNFVIGLCVRRRERREGATDIPEFVAVGACLTFLLRGMNDAFYVADMQNEIELTDQLRMQLLGALHVGSLRPGAKLPSIRETAERHRVDHRVAARAYMRLEDERLVQIRGRSGVYVADASSARMSALDDQARWLANVLTDGWARRVTFAELHNSIKRATTHRLRCVCVESTRDHLVAMSSELSADFGFTVKPICFNAAGTEVATADAHRIEAEIRSADVMITTAFHANAMRAIAETAGKPMIAICINPSMRDEIARHIQAGPLRVVVADTQFVERAMLFLKQMRNGANVQMVLAADYQPARHNDMPVLFTKAACRELGLPEFHLISGDTPFISAQSAGEISEQIIQLVLAKSD